MLKSFKTEINPSEEQKSKIRKTIGTCRFIYNFYLAHNKELYKNGEKFMSSNKFRVWLNNEYLSNHPEYLWIKESYSKAITQAVNNGQAAFTIKCGKPTPLGVGWIALLFFNNLCMFILILYTAYNIIIIWKIIIDTQTQQYL